MSEDKRRLGRLSQCSHHVAGLMKTTTYFHAVSPIVDKLWRCRYRVSQYSLPIAGIIEKLVDLFWVVYALAY